MSKFVPILVRLPAGVAQEVKAHCARSGMSISEGLRALVMQACREGLSDNRIERELERIGDDLNFAAVALDALLAGHPDPGLRARAHEAFDRKLARRRGATASGQGPATSAAHASSTPPNWLPRSSKTTRPRASSN